MSSTTPLQTSHPINFLIIGGGLCGLSCAFALQRVGHRVTILEKNPEVPQGMERGGCGLVPNLTKILNQWGLGPELRKFGLSMRTSHFYFARDSTEYIASRTYDDKILQEAGGGDWWFVSRGDLRGIMLRAAQEAGAQIITSTKVVSIDGKTRKVTIEDGREYTADVIIAADGSRGIGRKMMLGRTEELVPLGKTTYSTVIKAPDVLHRLTPPAFTDDEKAFYLLMGDGFSVYDFPMNNNGDHALCVVRGEDDGYDGLWGDEPSVNLSQVFAGCEPKLNEIFESSAPAVRVRSVKHEELEDWVDKESGRVLVVGEAAHPFVVGSYQGTALVVEDAAVLARLFSHLKSEDQIANFLWAFQDIREPRCKSLLEREAQRSWLFVGRQGPERDARDQYFRKLGEHKNTKMLDVEDDEPGAVFSYDCDDQGDEWWQNWGRFRERVRGGEGEGSFVLDSVQVGVVVEVEKQTHC